MAEPWSKLIVNPNGKAGIKRISEAIIILMDIVRIPEGIPASFALHHDMDLYGIEHKADSHASTHTV